MSDQHPQDPVDEAAVDPTTVDPVGMGVSSERVGPAGPGQVHSHGLRDTSAAEPEDDADVPPEQRPGQVEVNPADVEAKAAPPSAVSDGSV
jgi:hypothetical protein